MIKYVFQEGVELKEEEEDDVIDEDDEDEDVDLDGIIRYRTIQILEKSNRSYYKMDYYFFNI